MEPIDNMETTKPSADSDQEELDRFIAEIEDAADKEWAEEEEAEKEEVGKIRYWNKESFGDRRGEMYRNDGGGRDTRSWQDAHSRQRRTDRDSGDISEGEIQWDSDDVENSNVDNYEDDSDDACSSRSRRGRERKDRAPREYNAKNFSKNTEAKFRKKVSDCDSESEDMLNDLDNAMWESDTDEEHNSRASISEANCCFWSSSDKVDDTYSTKRNEMSWMNDLASDIDDVGEVLDDLGTSRDTKQKKYMNGFLARNAEASRRRTTQEDSALNVSSSSDADNEKWESGVPKNFEAYADGNYSDGDNRKNENYQRKRDDTQERNHKMKTPKAVDETWDSD